MKNRKYIEKDSNGLIFDGRSLHGTTVTIRITSDEYGKSMSLTAGNIQIQIPLEPIEVQLGDILR